MKKIKIFDTTLRDGEQAPGCGMNIDEKLEVARQLEVLGVDCIEAGFAVSSKGSFRAVQKIAETVRSCQVASLSRAVRKDIDASAEALSRAESPRIHIFLATSPIHMQYKLKISEDEVLEAIKDSVTYAREKCETIQFSAEDAMRSDRDFLVRAVETAIKAGADVINLPDTVGYMYPDEMKERVLYVCENAFGIEKVDVSVHCHNDLGMAVANSLAGILGGANQIECTINGIGERAGNCSLEEVVLAIKQKKNLFDAYTDINYRQINRSSRLVYNIIGMQVPLNKPIVGVNAFKHESGIHQHGVLANRETYEIMIPEELGITKDKLTIGKHSGRHAVADRLTELGYRYTENDLDLYFNKIKELADKKSIITDADIEAIIDNRERFKGAYTLKGFDVHTSKTNTSVCVVSLLRDGLEDERVSLGDGPINAAYNAIDKITGKIVDELVNYSIHSVSDGNDAMGEVTVRLKSGEKLVTGRGLSTNIIESSILAYINGINKLLEQMEA